MVEANNLSVHVITADTFGIVEKEIRDIPCELSILPLENQDEGKLQYVKNLGAATVVSIGNGRNDRLMLKEAVLGIAVNQSEGTSVGTISAADILTPDINSALDLLIHPLRLNATLRS